MRRGSFISLTFGVIIIHMAYHPEYYSVRAIAVILQYTEEFLAHLMNISLFYMDLENNMIGLERCEQILKIEIEKGSDNTDNLSMWDEWPKRGNIEFAFQLEEDLGLLVEYESKKDFQDISSEDILKEKERMLQELKNYQLDVSDDYDVKKAYQLILNRM